LGVQNAIIADTRSSQGAATLLRSTWLDGLGRPTQEVDADGVATCFTHGPFDALTSVERNCRGVTRLKSTTQYDALGHVIGQSDPDLGIRTSEWNAFGELVRHTDGAERVSTYVYDPLGRITSRTENEGTATYVYDTERYGFISSDSSPDGVTRYFDADAFGRMWRQTSLVSTPSGNDPYRFEWNYGPGGRVDTISYPTPDNEPSVVAKYVYDQAGYLRVVKDNALGGSGALEPEAGQRERDAAGRDLWRWDDDDAHLRSAAPLDGEHRPRQARQDAGPAGLRVVARR
jgi:YD repeat-containing protein